MSKLVPLISSGTAGPLGVLHLPRLWQKVSLEAAGKIADGYPGIGAGYDSMVINGLGLDAEAVRSFITDSKPTYPQFEAWVKEQPGANLDSGSVGELNASIEGYNHDDDTRQGILSANGLSDGDPKDAINLNNLDDWLEFHMAEIAWEKSSISQSLSGAGYPSRIASFFLRSLRMHANAFMFVADDLLFSYVFFLDFFYFKYDVARD